MTARLRFSTRSLPAVDVGMALIRVFFLSANHVVIHTVSEVAADL